MAGLRLWKWSVDVGNIILVFLVCASLWLSTITAQNDSVNLHVFSANLTFEDKDSKNLSLHFAQSTNWDVKRANGVRSHLSVDHTLGSSEGHYIRVLKAGNATLTFANTSAIFSSSTSCMEFSYVLTWPAYIEVIITTLTLDSRSETSQKYTINGNHSVTEAKWNTKSMELNFTNIQNITFFANKANRDAEIGLDDIYIIPGPCPSKGQGVAFPANKSTSVPVFKTTSLSLSSPAPTSPTSTGLDNDYNGPLGTDVIEKKSTTYATNFVTCTSTVHEPGCHNTHLDHIDVATSDSTKPQSSNNYMTCTAAVNCNDVSGGSDQETLHEFSESLSVSEVSEISMEYVNTQSLSLISSSVLSTETVADTMTATSILDSSKTITFKPHNDKEESPVALDTNTQVPPLLTFQHVSDSYMLSTVQNDHETSIYTTASEIKSISSHIGFKTDHSRLSKNHNSSTPKHLSSSFSSLLTEQVLTTSFTIQTVLSENIKATPTAFVHHSVSTYVFSSTPVPNNIKTSHISSDISTPRIIPKPTASSTTTSMFDTINVPGPGPQATLPTYSTGTSSPSVLDHTLEVYGPVFDTSFHPLTSSNLFTPNMSPMLTPELLDKPTMFVDLTTSASASSTQLAAFNTSKLFSSTNSSSLSSATSNAHGGMSNSFLNDTNHFNLTSTIRTTSTCSSENTTLQTQSFNQTSRISSASTTVSGNHSVLNFTDSDSRGVSYHSIMHTPARNVEFGWTLDKTSVISSLMTTQGLYLSGYSTERAYIHDDDTDWAVPVTISLASLVLIFIIIMVIVCIWSKHRHGDSRRLDQMRAEAGSHHTHERHSTSVLSRLPTTTRENETVLSYTMKHDTRPGQNFYDKHMELYNGHQVFNTRPCSAGESHEMVDLDSWKASNGSHGAYQCRESQGYVPQTYRDATDSQRYEQHRFSQNIPRNYSQQSLGYSAESAPFNPDESRRRLEPDYSSDPSRSNRYFAPPPPESDSYCSERESSENQNPSENSSTGSYGIARKIRDEEESAKATKQHVMYFTNNGFVGDEQNFRARRFGRDERVYNNHLLNAPRGNQGGGYGKEDCEEDGLYGRPRQTDTKRPKLPKCVSFDEGQIGATRQKLNMSAVEDSQFRRISTTSESATDHLSVPNTGIQSAYETMENLAEIGKSSRISKFFIGPSPEDNEEDESEHRDVDNQVPLDHNTAINNESGNEVLNRYAQRGSWKHQREEQMRGGNEEDSEHDSENSTQKKDHIFPIVSKAHKTILAGRMSRKLRERSGSEYSSGKEDEDLGPVQRSRSLGIDHDGQEDLQRSGMGKKLSRQLAVSSNNSNSVSSQVSPTSNIPRIILTRDADNKDGDADNDDDENNALTKEDFSSSVISKSPRLRRVARANNPFLIEKDKPETISTEKVRRVSAPSMTTGSESTTTTPVLTRSASGDLLSLAIHSRTDDYGYLIPQTSKSWSSEFCDMIEKDSYDDPSSAERFKKMIDERYNALFSKKYPELDRIKMSDKLSSNVNLSPRIVKRMAAAKQRGLPVDRTGGKIQTTKASHNADYLKVPSASGTRLILGKDGKIRASDGKDWALTSRFCNSDLELTGAELARESLAGPDLENERKVKSLPQDVKFTTDYDVKFTTDYDVKFTTDYSDGSQSPRPNLRRGTDGLESDSEISESDSSLEGEGQMKMSFDDDFVSTTLTMDNETNDQVLVSNKTNLEPLDINEQDIGNTPPKPVDRYQLQLPGLRAENKGPESRHPMFSEKDSLPPLPSRDLRTLPNISDRGMRNESVDPPRNENSVTGTALMDEATSRSSPSFLAVDSSPTEPLYESISSIRSKMTPSPNQMFDDKNIYDNVDDMEPRHFDQISYSTNSDNQASSDIDSTRPIKDREPRLVKNRRKILRRPLPVNQPPLRPPSPFHSENQHVNADKLNFEVSNRERDAHSHRDSHSSCDEQNQKNNGTARYAVSMEENENLQNRDEEKISQNVSKTQTDEMTRESTRGENFPVNDVTIRRPGAHLNSRNRSIFVSSASNTMLEHTKTSNISNQVSAFSDPDLDFYKESTSPSSSHVTGDVNRTAADASSRVRRMKNPGANELALNEELLSHLQISIV